LCFKSFHLRKASQTLMELAQLGNAFFDSSKPWVLAKDTEKKDELDTIIALSIECIKNLALLSSSIIPASAQKIWRMLGFQTELAKGNWSIIQSSFVPQGQILEEPEILFKRVEDEAIELQIQKLGNKISKEAPKGNEFHYEPLKEAITFGEFEKLDLRVAQVLEAEKVPKSKKLLRLLLDLGFEKRTVVSGIALSYEPEQMVGKKVILIANLAPAKIMGIESQGMILAASLASDLELPQIQNLAPGSTVS